MSRPGRPVARQKTLGRRIRGNPWLVSTLVTVGALAALEAGYRAAIRPAIDTAEMVTELDPVLLTRNRPGLALRLFERHVPVTTNRAGLRASREFGTKAPGTFRILALGDSCTFGYGVGDDETFCARLQQRLDGDVRRGPARYEVINAGVIGYTSGQGLRQLRRLGASLQPDLVIISFALNDAIMASSRLMDPSQREADLRGPSVAFAFVQNRLMGWSALWRAAMERIKQREWHILEARFQYGETLRDDQRLVPPAAYRENLAALGHVAGTLGARTIFLAMPVRLRTSHETPFVPTILVGERDPGTAALRDTRRAIARTRLRSALSAEWFCLGGLLRNRGDTRASLDAYLIAMELADFRQDLRWGGYLYASLAADVAGTRKAPFVNAVLTFYERELADNPPDLYVDPYHPGPLGHRIIADLLFPQIRAMSAPTGSRPAEARR